jgi:fluoroquinolone transport system permease protein
MRRFINLTKWQLVLLSKYNILTVAIAMAVFYALLLIIFPVINVDEFVGYVIFSDPGQLGFIFIGAMVLFEKSENTLPAQNITPMSASEYLWTKATALLVPTVIGSLGIAFAAWRIDFNFIVLIITVVLTSLIFTFLGLAGVARVKTFNQYVLVIPLFLAPTALPLLNFLNITQWKFLYVIPTQSVLSLLGICRYDNLSWLEVILHFVYLVVWVYVAYRIALKFYIKYLTK